VLRIDADHELFNAARLGLGALGVLVEITLRCVPAFKLHAVERPEKLEAVLESFRERSEAADHFEFYWFPHTTTALTKTNTRLPLSAESRPLGRVKRWIDDDLMANRVFAGVCGVSRAVPALVPPINRLAQRLTGDREFTDVSTGVFTTERRVRFREMEYAVPRAAAPEVLRELQRVVEASDWRIPFPVEVRVAAADDIPLSTASDRDSAYVAVHVPARQEPGDYFAALEAIAGSVGGRPHWGKLHGLGAGELAARYPRFEEFTALRDRLDPSGVFANAHLDRVLGPVGAALRSD
jgi:L-gulono-1,4-lactone dehydrogenase